MRKLATILFLPVVILISTISCNTGTNSDSNQSQETGDTTRKKVELSQTELHNLNSFLTKFSEVHLFEFSKDKLADSVLVQFGVYYNYRNHFKAFTQIPEGLKASISETMVTDTALKFFDVKIKNHQSTDWIKYKDGNYIIDNSDGEAYRFSQVKELYDLGNGLFSVIFEIYSGSSGFTGDINASPETWKTNSADEEVPQSEGIMKALIRKITENGETRYVLLEYLK